MMTEFVYFIRGVSRFKSGCLIALACLSAPVVFGNSFESPDDLAPISGNVTLDTNVYRFGSSSLCWKAAPGDSLTLPVVVTQGNYLRGVSFWLYNPKRNDAGTVNVVIGNAEAQRDCSFEIPLNFENWRLIRVEPETDVSRVYNPSATEGMTITWSGEGNLTLNLDAFLPMASWQRTPNLQIPSANPNRTAMHSNARGVRIIPDYLSQVQKFKECAPATPEQKAAIEQLRQKASEWLLSPEGPAAAELMAKREALILKDARAAWSRCKALEVRRCGNAFQFKSGDVPRDGFDPNWTEIVNKILMPLTYAYRMDIEGNEFYNDPEVCAAAMDLFALLHYQGFAAGSDHNWFAIFFIKGMGQSVFLMAPELQKAGLFDPLADAVLWYSRFMSYAAFPPELSAPSADLLRGTFPGSLLTMLTFDDDKANAHLQAFKEVINRQLKVTGGIGDLIKRDGSAFHHGQAAHAYYGPDGLHSAVVMAWLLHGTPYEIDEAPLTELRRALIVFDQQQNEYDTPSVTNVRWPFASGTAKTLVSAYAYMVLMNPDDELVAGTFRRLNQPQELKDVRSDPYNYRNTPGEIRAMVEAAEVAERFEINPPAEGCFNFSNSALLIHRRDHWMAAVRGFSKYAWDFEIGIRSPNGYENKYGRFLSHGRLQIFANGKNAERSGYVDVGWDFCHHPGTTSLVMPVEELELPLKMTYGRNYNSATLVGGGTINGENGVYAFDMRDPVVEDFTALKSYHFNGNCIVALGSNIRCGSDSYEVDTTIYQNYTGQRLKTNVEQNVSSDIPTVLTDKLRTVYYIPAGQQLTVSKKRQTGPNNSGRNIDSGIFEQAVLHHGRAPENAEYEYAVFINPEPGTAERLAVEVPYEVLQANEAAHVVYFSSNHLVSAVVAQPDKDLPEHLPVRQMSKPGLLLCQTDPVNGQITISVTDPDFGWDGDLHDLGIDEFPAPSEITLQLRGDWQVVGGEAELSGEVCQLTVEPGISKQFVIKPK